MEAGRYGSHCRARLGGSARKVRDEQHVFKLQQIGMDRRLVLVHVERGAGEQVLLQRPRERLLVYDRAAGSVDEHGGRWWAHVEHLPHGVLGGLDRVVEHGHLT